MSYRFAKVYRPEHRNPAIGSPGLHLELRMWLLAVDRMQRGGHAPLGSGELELILDKDDGNPYNPSRYRQARGNLIKAGLLAPSANARCLLVPHTVASMDARSRKKREECARHGHNIPWDGQHGDWLFETQEAAHRWEAECDNIGRRGSSFPTGEWARSVRLQAEESVNRSEPSAA
ncbi:hypothetical protein [Streptomyces lasiicapitis]|uniref:Uncharacterized protein n=1 Tax=Streptomyces lasiicapitis TaxID=1923961 RepID=A0ABQ2MHN8_9ACTN|nr:hypothetical protein [Streptomyces lasiicapitis]GGO52291.1 hypothetical protein GCM10012286_56970 [Streptomyces lasiicapitis]